MSVSLFGVDVRVEYLYESVLRYVNHCRSPEFREIISYADDFIFTNCNFKTTHIVLTFLYFSSSSYVWLKHYVVSYWYVYFINNFL